MVNRANDSIDFTGGPHPVVGYEEGSLGRKIEDEVVDCRFLFQVCVSSAGKPLRNEGHRRAEECAESDRYEVFEVHLDIMKVKRTTQ